MTVLHSNVVYIESEVPSFKTRSLTVSYVTRHPKMVQSPAIRIAGDWLEKVGFKIGAELDVKITHGCIVISPK